MKQKRRSSGVSKPGSSYSGGSWRSKPGRPSYGGSSGGYSGGGSSRGQSMNKPKTSYASAKSPLGDFLLDFAGSPTLPGYRLSSNETHNLLTTYFTECPRTRQLTTKVERPEPVADPSQPTVAAAITEVVPCSPTRPVGGHHPASLPLLSVPV